MAIKDAQINQLNKGINTDVHNKFQPEGTYRYAQNAVLSTEEGDYGSISNEPGTELCAALGPTEQVIGSVKLDNDEFVIFIVDRATGNSRISLFNTSTKAITDLVDDSADPCLNFRTSHPISALFRIARGCERTIYFTDNLNPYRVINIDSLDQYNDPITGNFDCDRIKLTRDINDCPTINSMTVRDFGGNLPVGTYQFVVRYLDSDGNPTNWFSISNPIPIFDEPYFGDYSQIDGAVNNAAVTGGVPATNKSIQISLTNLDQTFASYQIASLHNTAGTGEVSAVYITPSQPIFSTTDEYIYTGNIASYTTSALADITVDNIAIDRVETHAQLDNRLFLANIEGKEYDWAEVQRAANQITTSWRTSIISRNDIDNAVKGAEYYLNIRSHQRDEVYAFAIYGKLVNGTRTPAFHIPGREEILNGDPLIATGNANPHYRNTVDPGQDWDKQILTVVAGAPATNNEVNIDDVRHLGFNVIGDDPFGLGAGQVHRWKVYNTGIHEGAIVNVGDFGQMAYYEADDVYPEVRDCSNNLIYPNDGASTLPIRHHRFPDSMLTPFMFQPGVTDLYNVSPRPIGVRFDLTAFTAALPAEVTADVRSWHIARVNRSEATKTILDKGYVQITHEWDSATNPTAATATRNNVFWFNSPSVYLRNRYPGGSHVKFLHPIQEYRIGFGGTTDGTGGGGDPAALYGGTTWRPAVHEWYVTRRLGFDAINQHNRQISSSIFIDPSPVFQPTGATAGVPGVFDNHSGIDVGNAMYNKRRLSVALTDTYDPAPVLAADPTFTDDGVMPHRVYYASIRNDNFNLYTDIGGLSYHDVHSGEYTSNDVVFGGDIFLSKFADEERFTQDEDVVNPNIADYSYITVGSNVREAWYESEVNSGLRHKGEPEFKDYWESPNIINNTPNSGSTIYEELIEGYFNGAFLRIASAGGPQDSDTLTYFAYNEDYSKTNREKIISPLSELYDYCSDCINKYPYRILYSERSFQEQALDNYRQFLANNYADILGNTGEINKLFVDKDNLYALTSKGIYFVPTRPQTLTTNESNIFVGTGDVLSIPPRRLVSTDYGYGGCKDKFSVVTTEFGTVYVDELSGAIMHLGEQLKEISAEGQRQWFKINTPLKLIAAYDALNLTVDYPYRNTVHPEGVGFWSVYDPFFKRLIIHKRDFVPINPATVTFNSTNTTNYPDGQWEEVGSGTPVFLADASRFENRSWTASFSFPHNAWSSYHTYYPIMMFNDEDTFYAKYLSGIRKHNFGPYQNYEGTKRDHIIDFVINKNPMQTKTLSSVQYVSDVSLYDTTRQQFVDINDSTFNRGIFYNSYQTTGNVTMNVYTPPFSAGNVRRHENTWSINDIRNIVTNNAQPIWTSNWTDVGLSPFPFKVPNPLAIDATKSLFQQDRLRDKWFGIRLSFNPTQDYKITTDILQTIISNSFR